MDSRFVPNKKTLGVLLGLISAISFGIMSVLVKVYSIRFPSSELMFFRGTIGGLLLFLKALPDIDVLFHKSGGVLWVRFFCGAGSILCLFHNLQVASVGDAVSLASLSPLFVASL